MFFDKINKYPKSLRNSIIEGMFNSIMVGGALTFVVPFAIFLGANSLEVGVLTAVPALFAAWIQLGSIKLLSFYKKRKSAIIMMVALQALSWLLIALIPFIFPTGQVFWLILITTAGTIVGAICSPLWQSWMRSITPSEIMGEYFGARNALAGAVVFGVMMIAGLWLQLFDNSFLLYAFCGIFALSFIGRALSAFFFTKMDEPEVVLPKEKISFLHFVKQMGQDNFGHVVLLGMLINFSLATIGPFLSIYLLKTLGLSNDYILYTLIIAASTLSSILAMPYWGRIVDKFGYIKLIRATTLLMILHPLALIFIRDPMWLVPLELLNGVILSGFTMGLANFIYEAFPDEKIIKYASYQSALFGTATFLGTMFAGALLIFTINLPILTDTFYVVCLIAVAYRIIVHVVMRNKIKEIHLAERIRTERVAISMLTMAPITQPLLSHVVPLLSTAENATVNGVKRVEGATIRGLTKAERAAIYEMKRVEELAEKEISAIKKRAKERRAAKAKKKA
ncbi:Major Facilitator Superfamily protein [uncultured archaeon]|nr:Major Facilitator Superfamily protein [uncultured archaeon]